MGNLDRIVVFAGSDRILDMLRPARSTRRHAGFVDRFAVAYRQDEASPPALQGAVATVIAIGQVEPEHRLVQAARRLRVPIHVESRPLVSDFTMLELVERRPSSFARW